MRKPKALRKLFGIFLTPVFFYVIQWFADRRAASGEGGPPEAVEGNGTPHSPTGIQSAH